MTQSSNKSWFWAALTGAVVGSAISNTGLLSGRNAVATLADVSSQDRTYQELGRADSLLHEMSRTMAKVAAIATPSVVHIQSSREGNGRGPVTETGSGVTVASGKSGLYVVTNRHVIEGAKVQGIAISLHDGRVISPTQIWSDKETDLAVLKLPVTDVPSARWGDSNQVEIGHMVLAVGSPFGLNHSVTSGIISAKGRRSLELGKNKDLMNQDFMQTDAAINPGNSGGPLIDLQGRVIGINTAIASSGGGNEGIGFSIPSNLVQHIMNQLLEFGEVRRAYLGVELDDNFGPKAAMRLGLNRVQGARVTKVTPDTPAALAKLSPDDVIISFDGQEVDDHKHLIHLVTLTPLGRTVQVVVVRDHRKLNLQLQLTDRSVLADTQNMSRERETLKPVIPQQSRRQFNQ